MREMESMAGTYERNVLPTINSKIEEIALKKEHEEDERSHMSKYWLYYFFILLEATVIILFWRFTTYSELGDVANQVTKVAESGLYVNSFYPFFQDVHVMIFVGFGFLMTFLKSHSWTSVGMNFLLGAWIIQVALLTNGFWHAILEVHFTDLILLDVKAMINADFAAGSILIAFGAVLGKLTFMQYLVMATIQCFFYSLCNEIGVVNFIVADIGGSMFIHAFGALFGLTVALVTKKEHHYGHPSNGSNYNSNIFSMIGTIFLWMYWPSFNAALYPSDNGKHRCIINTYLSLTSSCVMVFLLNPFFKKGKLHMENILNATLAGGVMIGCTADAVIYPWVALLIGAAAGSISIIGYEFLTPVLAEKIGLYDTCGINNLHFMPGFLGGIIGVVIAGSSSAAAYGPSYSVIYPAINSRTPAEQAGYQLAALFLVVGTALITGFLTGLLLNSKILEDAKTVFDDNHLWEIEEDHDELKRVESHVFTILKNSFLKKPANSTNYDIIRSEDYQTERNHRVKDNEIHIEIKESRNGDKFN